MTNAGPMGLERLVLNLESDLSNEIECEVGPK